MSLKMLKNVPGKVLPVGIAGVLLAGTVLAAGAAEFIDLTKDVSMSVKWADDDFKNDLAGREDSAKVDVVLDVYKLADAEVDTGYDAYVFSPLAGFTDIGISEDMTEKDADSIAQGAAKVILSESYTGTPIEVTLDADAGATVASTDGLDASTDGLDAGLYLLIVKEKDAALADYRVEEEDGTLSTKVNSDMYTYTVSPQLISIPSRSATSGVTTKTSDSGDWQYAIDVELKAKRELRTGDLEIIKSVTTFNTAKSNQIDDVTFVFDVEGVDKDGNQVYSNVVTLNFSEAGTKKTTITDLPVGTRVTVTEVYSGGQYSLTTDEENNPQIITADTVAQYKFVNDYNEGENPGHGITNSFSHDGKQWVWDAKSDNADGNEEVLDDHKTANSYTFSSNE